MKQTTLTSPYESVGLLHKRHEKDSDYFQEKLTEHGEDVVLCQAISVGENKYWVTA